MITLLTCSIALHFASRYLPNEQLRDLMDEVSVRDNVFPVAIGWMTIFTNRKSS